jgi:hypothetical protein
MKCDEQQKEWGDGAGRRCLAHVCRAVPVQWWERDVRVQIESGSQIFAGVT